MQVSRIYPWGNFAFGEIRLVASDEKATKRPLKLNTGSWLSPLGIVPFAPDRNYLRSAGGPGVNDKRERHRLANAIGVRTVTCTAPGMAMSAAEIGMLTCDVLTNAAVAVPKSGIIGVGPKNVCAGDEITAVYRERETPGRLPSRWKATARRSRESDLWVSAHQRMTHHRRRKLTILRGVQVPSSNAGVANSQSRGFPCF